MLFVCFFVSCCLFVRFLLFFICFVYLFYLFFFVPFFFFFFGGDICFVCLVYFLFFCIFVRNFNVKRNTSHMKTSFEQKEKKEDSMNRRNHCITWCSVWLRDLSRPSLAWNLNSCSCAGLY